MRIWNALTKLDDLPDTGESFLVIVTEEVETAHPWYGSTPTKLDYRGIASEDLNEEISKLVNEGTPFKVIKFTTVPVSLRASVEGIW